MAPGAGVAHEGQKATGSLEDSGGSRHCRLGNNEH